MHADLAEIKEMVEKTHIPMGGAARSDMAERLRGFARQHIGDMARIEDGDGRGGHFHIKQEDRDSPA